MVATLRGGWLYATRHGLDTEEDYPYKAVDGVCKCGPCAMLSATVHVLGLGFQCAGRQFVSACMHHAAEVEAPLRLTCSS